MKIRTIIIILVLVYAVIAGGAYIRSNYVNKTNSLEQLENDYKRETRTDLLRYLVQYDIYGYYKNHTEYREYYRKIGRDLKTDKVIVDFINTILPYYDLTYENSKAEFEVRAEKIQDIIYTYKAKLSLDDRLKILEFLIKTIKEKDITHAYKAKLSLEDRLKIVEFQVKAIKEK